MSKESRENILNAAEKEFSLKGYDGARVDKIAEEAGINKALIYYYFNSKKELLKALYERLIKTGFQAIDFSILTGGDSPEDEEKRHEILHSIIHFLETHHDIIRILFMESLKGNGENMLLDLADFYLDEGDGNLFSSFNTENIKKTPDKNQWMMTEVFTAMMPLICYVLFKSDIQKRLSVSIEEMDHYFMESLEETHFRSHKNLEKNYEADM